MPKFVVSTEPEPKVDTSPSEPLILDALTRFKEAPLIGLEYVVEILRSRSEPIYKCMICRRTFESDELIADVISTTHRLGYLVSNLLFQLNAILRRSHVAAGFEVGWLQLIMIMIGGSVIVHSSSYLANGKGVILDSCPAKIVLGATTKLN